MAQKITHEFLTCLRTQKCYSLTPHHCMQHIGAVFYSLSLFSSFLSSHIISVRNLTGRQQFSNYVVFMSSWKSPHKSNKFCKSRVFLHEAASPSTIQKSRHDQKGVKLWPSREQIKFLAIKVLQKGVSLFHWGELLRSVIFKNYFSVVL